METLTQTTTIYDVLALARHFAAQPAPLPTGLLQPDKVRAGAEVSRQALCGTCHLPNYAGQNQVPRLAGQHEDYLVLTLKSDHKSTSSRIHRQEQASANRFHSEIRLQSPGDVDQELKAWLRHAYELAGSSKHK